MNTAFNLKKVAVFVFLLGLLPWGLCAEVVLDTSVGGLDVSRQTALEMDTEWFAVLRSSRLFHVDWFAVFIFY